MLRARRRRRSDLQRDYRRSLVALGVLVALVLLIACANVANLMTAQAAARAREMALRVSIGAGRWRLVQLVLVESAWLGVPGRRRWAGCSPGGPAPFVVSMINPPDNPRAPGAAGRLARAGFRPGAGLGVTLLFGLAPALRASAVKPASALQGGEDPAFAPAPDARADRRAGRLLFPGASSSPGCSSRPSTACRTGPPASPPNGFSISKPYARGRSRRSTGTRWPNICATVPGVETVALTGWPLLSGNDVEWASSPSTARLPAPCPGLLSERLARLARCHEDSAARRPDFRPTDDSPGVPSSTRPSPSSISTARTRLESGSRESGASLASRSSAWCAMRARSAICASRSCRRLMFRFNR